MKKSIGLILACVLVFCFGLSCEKIAPPVETAPQIASPISEIPAEYGSLVSVTAIPEYTGWFQLWFEDDAGTVRMIRIQAFKDLMHSEVKTYSRSQPALKAAPPQRKLKSEVKTDEE